LRQIVFSEFEEYELESANFEDFQNFVKTYRIEPVTCNSVLLYLHRLKLKEKISSLEERNVKIRDKHFKFLEESSEKTMTLTHTQRKREEEVERWNKYVDYSLFASTIALFFVCRALKKRHKY